MKNTIVVLLILLSYPGFSQTFLNLDFEYPVQGTNKPQKWYTGGNGYIVALDDQEKANNSMSIKITSNNPNENEFGAITGYFPFELVKGKTIEFTGKIKTLDIKDGYAGLWWRVDGKNGTLGFDNMSNRGLKGTHDWKEVSIKMKVNEDVTGIYFGGLFSGKGTAWFDDFKVTMDGEKFIDTEPKISLPTPGELAWLRQAIYPLKTYDPASASNEDLQILKKLIGDSKVIALGETTHGSSEIFKMKNRIIQYLSENKGFDIFSIEANMPESYKLNEYILEGRGNPTDLIKGMYFWTWRTQEVLNMVEWMRDRNESGKKIVFTGFDMQFYFGAVNEFNEAFKDNPEIKSVITELKTTLDVVASERKNSRTITVTQENRKKITGQLISLQNTISISDFSETYKKWLLQNIRVIEQYLDTGARDKYMAENLLWIKSQNPGSKIIAWAHNGHIKETGNSMGKFLSDSLKNDYLTIGFTFHKGNYTAIGNNGLSNYMAQESYPGTYEFFFNSIDVPVFILDLREVKKQNSPDSKWLSDVLGFRSVGAVKTDSEFYETDLTDDFDLIIFINESTHSTLLE
jgi:erythromycin esterase